jgi:hypothetical protein
MSRPELATDRVVVVRGGGDRLDTDHLVQIEVAGPDRRALSPDERIVWSVQRR